MTIKQRDRNLLLKNETYGKQMENLIKNFQQRDTNSNIKKIMAQLEKIDEKTQRKSISMYKIKQMMDMQMKEFKEGQMISAGAGKSKQDEKNQMQKLMMSDEMKCHFKSLTSFINAYRMKMTQSSSVSTAAQAIAAIGNSKRNAAENEEISL